MAYLISVWPRTQDLSTLCSSTILKMKWRHLAKNKPFFSYMKTSKTAYLSGWPTWSLSLIQLLWKNEWLTSFCYRQDCRVAANCRFFCFYSQAKNQVFRPPRRGDSLHRFRSNFAGPTDTWVRLAVQNFTSIGAEGWECGPQKAKISTFWYRVAPHGRLPWPISKIFIILWQWRI